MPSCSERRNTRIVLPSTSTRMILPLNSRFVTLDLSGTCASYTFPSDTVFQVTSTVDGIGMEAVTLVPAMLGRNSYFDSNIPYEYLMTMTCSEPTLLIWNEWSTRPPGTHAVMAPRQEIKAQKTNRLAKRLMVLAYSDDLRRLFVFRILNYAVSIHAICIQYQIHVIA
jgi:hypothetical protein